MNLEHLISTFIVLWAVIDPIGTVPVFLAVTRNYDSAERKRIARIAVGTAFLILMFFIFVGEILLNYLGVPLLAFQVSGGIILFIFALSMIFGESKPEEEVRIVKNGDETAVFPLATPSIAGPGAIMAVVLLTDNSQHSFINQLITVCVLLAVLLCQLFLLKKSDVLHKYLGDAGASVISRVMGLILAAVASTNVLSGIKQYFEL
ncbi:MAG TPA: MarC family transcriptional regulator [Opitutae bacterium]|nr:MarC family transcriptional regulator [Opitutae bacterium]